MMAPVFGSPEASSLSKDSVFKLAENIARQLKYEPCAPLEPIVESLGGRINYRDFWELESSESGSIEIRDDRDFDIYLAAHTGPLRDRFTIAHELGHYVLHFLVPKKQGLSVGPIRARRYGTGRVEWEANWFAAAFLMPEKAFAKAFQLESKDLGLVAERFGVSEIAVTNRARSLGLI